MSITLHIFYHGEGDNARRFAQEMISSGTVEAIRSVAGNLHYDYFFPMEDPETVLLIDSWESQEAIDRHHASPMMETVAKLRIKYDLHMEVERFHAEELPQSDNKFIKQ